MSAKDTAPSRDDLVSFFLEGCRPREKLRVGIEVEKPAVYRENGKGIRYRGKRGLEEMIRILTEHLGWEVEKEDKGYPLLLKRGKSEMSLEVGGAVEYAGDTYQSLHELALDYRFHVNEMREVAQPLGIKFLGLGIQPLTNRKEHERILKTRYRHILAYSEEVSDLKTSWHLKCTSIQVNIDSTSRKNLERKFRLLTRISPVITAMFANSVINHGKLSHSMSTRMSIGNRAQLKRYNPPKEFFQRSFSVEQFVEYVLDLPMIFIVRNGRTIRVKNRTFRQYMEKGYQKYRATMEDFTTHISFLYTDVRLKKYIEFRAADSVPPSLVPACAAVVKGLMYNSNGWNCIEELTRYWTYEDYMDFRNDAARHGLQAKVRNTTALDLAKEVLNTATENLRRTKRTDLDGNDETVYLEPIKDYVFVREQSPAEYVADLWESEWHKSIVKLIEWSEY